MNVIYSESNSADKKQADLIRQMEHIHSQCVDFSLTCCSCNDKWGLWLTIGGERCLVNPLDLVNSLYVDDVYYIFLLDGVEEYSSCCVDIRKEKFCMTWNTNHPDSPIKGRLMFRFDEYVHQIRVSIEQLYEAMKTCETIYSKFDLSIEALEVAVAQLRIKSALPSVYQLRACNVVEETFEFTVLDYDKYRLGVGNRCFTTFMMPYGRELELIRHQLESVFYGEVALIKILFDELETVLEIEQKSILDEVICINGGYRYTYKEYAKVTIQPNGFTLTPIIVGYCNLKETVRTLYEGLLRMALLHKEKGANYSLGLIEAYNMCKSPLIETYLSDDKISRCKSSVRQVRIMDIVTISPDYDCCLINQYNCAIDISDLHDEQGSPIEMPELEVWSSEIKHLIVESEVGRDIVYDWHNWHKRGMELAKQLRKKLPRSCDLWYDPPFEDKSGAIMQKILIM